MNVRGRGPSEMAKYQMFAFMGVSDSTILYLETEGLA